MKKLSDYHALLFSLLIIMGLATAGTMIMPIAQLLMPNWQVSNAVSSDVVDGATVEAVFSNLDANVKTVITNTGSDLFYSISNPSNYISAVEFEGFILYNTGSAAGGTNFYTSATAESWEEVIWNGGDFGETDPQNNLTLASGVATYTPDEAGYYQFSLNLTVWNLGGPHTNGAGFVEGAPDTAIGFKVWDGTSETIWNQGQVSEQGAGNLSGGITLFMDGVDDEVTPVWWVQEASGGHDQNDYYIRQRRFSGYRVGETIP